MSTQFSRESVPGMINFKRKKKGYDFIFKKFDFTLGKMRLFYHHIVNMKNTKKKEDRERVRVSR